MTKKILLISNSISYGKGYLDHCADEIIDFLEDIQQVLFIPYALHDWDKYEQIAKTRFGEMDKTLTSIHRSADPQKAIANAEAVFIGGGNTFRLLNQLYKNRLI